MKDEGRGGGSNYKTITPRKAISSQIHARFHLKKLFYRRSDQRLAVRDAKSQTKMPYRGAK